ncbi:hypothetical protein S83_050578 [Arachis hypogaea]
MQATRKFFHFYRCLSSDYAASTWCLNEMATIAQCKKEFGQKIFSVFYYEILLIFESRVGCMKMLREEEEKKRIKVLEK